MMEIVPEKIGNAVVFSARHVCPMDEINCQLCSDYAVGIHNWLVASDIHYVIVDLQDEKEVCPELIVELLQLRKRLKCPFYFAGAMEKCRRVLSSYGFPADTLAFSTPEKAVEELTRKFPQLVQKSLDGLMFGQSLSITRPRGGIRVDGVAVGEGSDGSEESEIDEH